MRILICAFTYPPNRDGVAAAAEAMAHGLSEYGHEITVATGPLAKRGGSPSMVDGIEVYEFDGEAPDRKREVARLQEWIIGQEFDLIVCHCWHLWPTDEVAVLGRRTKAKKILVSHGFTPHLVDWYPRPFWGFGPWLRALPFVLRMPWHLRDFDWVTVLSARPDFHRFFDLWLARATGYRHISTIPNGTYPARFGGSGDQFRETFGISETLLFLCVANYSPRKNQKLAVRAFRQAQLNDAVLVFIGSELGDYGREVQALDGELARTQPLGRVMCLEKVGQALTVDAYAASDVFVLSAKAETQPIVLLESMAAGKPWISTDTGCVRELPGGIVVTNERELVAAMQALGGNREARSKLGNIGRRASTDHFTWKASMATYQALFQRLANE